VDTDLFSPGVGPTAKEERAKLRHQLGFAQNEIVCIYTGRFSDAKNPLCLSQSIDGLRSQGAPFRGLFIGSGPQEAAIRECSGCVVQPFIPVHTLAQFYRAADIAVWPTQESTSMLDAAACGLPIVVSNRLIATERVKDNGLTYEEGSAANLMRTLQTLNDPDIRKRLGKAGTTKMRQQYSWLAIAKHKLQDYEAALRR
jgi:glycosyltransferase involved in cell wall biosynthesis